MNATNGQNNLAKSWEATIGRFVFLFCVIWLGIVSVLLYFKLASLVSIVLTFAAVLSLSISITAFLIHKRPSSYSILALIIGCFLLISGLTLGYGNALSFPTKAYINQIGSGLSNIGFGLAFITSAIAILSLNKSGFGSSFKITKFIMISLLICGIFLIGLGVYSLVSGFQYL